MTEKLTPEQAAELNRMRAAKRQADRRRRDREMAAEEARVLAEAEAERASLEAARTERMADLERRLSDAQRELTATQDRLDDAIMLLAVGHDIKTLIARGAAASNTKVIEWAQMDALRRFHAVASRTWTIPKSEALERTRILVEAVEGRIPTLASGDEPYSLLPNVTSPDTPVTPTVRSADRPERIADRSHEAPEISIEEQAWIDQQGQSPYDEYEARIAHIEAIAEGAIDPDDEDDGERF